MFALIMLAGITLFDFETPEEIKAVPATFRTNMTVCVTNRFSTSGKNALAFHAADWHEGMPQWPSFTIPVRHHDWRGYDRLVLDIFNDGDGGTPIMLYAYGPNCERSKGVKSTYSRLPDHTYDRWIIPLDPWPETVAVTNVTHMHIFYIRPRGARLYIDRMQLLKKGEKPSPFCGEGLAKDFFPSLLGKVARAEEAASDAIERADLGEAYWAFREKCRIAGQDVREMLVASATSMDIVRPRQPDLSAMVPAKELSVRLARNEYESVQLVVVPGDADLADVRVSVSDLASKDGATFAASNIACDITGYVKVKHDVPYGIGPKKEKPGRGWWPEPILDFMDGTDVKGRDFQSFWIRVKCPADQPAGIYGGKATVVAKTQGKVVRRELPFAVRVNDFALGKIAPMPMAITYGPCFYFPTHYRSPRIREYDAYRKDPLAPANAARRKENNDLWTDFLADYLITSDSLYLRGCSDEHIDQLKRLKAQGRLNKFNIGYWIDMPEGQDGESAFIDKTVSRLRESYEKVKAAGLLDHAYIYGCDEASSNRFGRIERSLKRLRKEFPDVPLITTAYDHDYGLVNRELSLFDAFVPLTQRYDLEKAEKARAAGRKVWWYICCGPRAPYANMFMECPGTERRLLFGAMSSKYRPDGFLYYHTSIWNQKRCITSGPFTDWEPRSYCEYDGDGCWLCVGPEGRPLPTQRLENFRDGLEDLAYAKLLRERLAANPRVTWADRAKRLLDAEGLVASMTDYTADPSAILAWRDAMADLIEKASTALKTENTERTE
jgi:hypothetical protein